jgi:hypothetical protein
MRTIIAATILFLAVAAAQAQQVRSDGTSLYERCGPAASVDLADLKGADFTKATSCLSYLVAVHAALSRIHEYYQTTMPNYGNWTDEAFFEQWSARQRMLAPDVCFPAQITPKMLAMTIAGYGKAHPEELVKYDRFDFAGRAFARAYPCR